MHAINVPVACQLHLYKIDDRNDGNLDAMYGQVFRSQRRIRHRLMGLDLFTGEDETDGISGLRFAVR
jgi:hypothetical protein